MKMFKTLIAVVFVAALAAATAIAAEKTCCEKAEADGKDCTMPCCLAAHNAGKFCEKCNPNKEDLKRDSRKEEKKARQSATAFPYNQPRLCSCWPF